MIRAHIGNRHSVTVDAIRFRAGSGGPSRAIARQFDGSRRFLRDLKTWSVHASAKDPDLDATLAFAWFMIIA